MIPTVFVLGPIHLYSYGLLLAAGLLLSLYLMRHRAAKEGFPQPDDCTDIMLAVFVWGFSGARLFYVLQNFSYFAANPLRVFAVWEGGLIFYGGVVASLVGFSITVRMKKLSFWKALDFIAPYTALTQAFGRVGCFLNGCCYGKPCDLPWAVHFPQAEGLVHPAQVYEAAYTLVLFAFLLKRSRAVRFEGEISLLYLMLYALGRFLIEFVREPGLTWLGLTHNQWTSIVIITMASLIFQARRRSALRKAL
jgi:phosphatidylglycerol:prolipoprotein diacylglycerol transferase